MTNEYCELCVALANTCVQEGIIPLEFPYKQNHPNYSVKALDRTLFPDAEEIEARFGLARRNVGILLDNRYVDLDPDWLEARRLAFKLLDADTWCWGRQLSEEDNNAHISHYLYQCDDYENKISITPPACLVKPDDKGAIIELLGGKNGIATLPPSVHPSGFPLRFYAGPKGLSIKEEASIRKRSTEELKLIAHRIAGGSVLIRIWDTVGSRHHLTLHLAGACLKAGWCVGDVEKMLDAIIACAGDDELQDRLTAIQTTVDRFEDGQAVSGLKDLRQELGNDEVADFLVEHWRLEQKAQSSSSSGDSWPELETFSSWNDIPQIDYPINALGPILGAAAREFVDQEGIDASLIAQAMLAASAAILQARFSVVCSKYRTLLSLFLLTLAASGSGKTQAESYAYKTIERYLSQQMKEFRKEKADSPGEPLRSPIFMLKSVTTAGLLRHLHERSPHVIVQHSDGMAFLGSYAFKEGRSNETVSTFCDLWSGKPAAIAQGHMEEVLYAPNRALSLSLAIQPEFAAKFLLNRELESQGLLPRSLIVFPRPIFQEPSFEDDTSNAARQAFYDRIEEILSIPVLMDQESGEISFRPLTMDRPALKLYRQLVSTYKRIAFDNKDGLKPYYERTAENTRRLAGILAVMNGSDHIELCHVVNAHTLMKFYMDEWVWMRAKLRTHGDHMSQAQELWNWMCSRRDKAGETSFDPSLVNRAGPRVCRNNIQMTKALFDELVQRGYLKQNGRLYRMRP